MGGCGEQYINDDDGNPLHGFRKRRNLLSNCLQST